MKRQERVWTMGWGWRFAIACALCFIVFGPSLSGPFVYDDFHQPYSRVETGSEPYAMWLGGVRPLLMGTFLLNYQISGIHPFSFHVVNLILHAFAGCLAYSCALRLIDLAQLPKPRRQWFAGASAGLFLLHPLQTESVDYISSRSEILTAVFMLGALLIFLRAFDTNLPPMNTVAVLVLSACAVLSKEQAVVLPALFLLTDLVFGTGTVLERVTRRSGLYLVFGLGAVTAGVLILRGLQGATSAGFGMQGITWTRYLATELQVIPIYLRLFFLPFGQTLDWRYPLAASLPNAWSIAGLILLASIVVVAFRMRRRAPLFTYGTCWFLVLLAPTSSVVPLADPLAEHRMYLPLFGLALALVGWTAQWNASRRTLQRVAWVAFALLAAVTWSRSRIWASDVALWSEAFEKNPGNTRAGVGYGVALMKAGLCDQAAAEFGLLQKDPDIRTEVLFNRAQALECAHRPQEALADLSEVAKAKRSADTFLRIGILSGKLGRVDQARLALDEAIHLDPASAQAYACRGVLKASENDPAAVDDLNRSLQLDPANQLAAQELARLSQPK